VVKIAIEKDIEVIAWQIFIEVEFLKLNIYVPAKLVQKYELKLWQQKYQLV